MTHKIGLVLSGCGGKGAYEVGVWKASDTPHRRDRIRRPFSGNMPGFMGISSC